METLVLLLPAIMYFSIVAWGVFTKTRLAKKVLIGCGILMLPALPIGLPVLIFGIVSLNKLTPKLPQSDSPSEASTTVGSFASTAPKKGR